MRKNIVIIQIFEYANIGSDNHFLKMVAMFYVSDSSHLAFGSLVPRLRKKSDIEANGDYERDSFIPPKGKGEFFLHILRYTINSIYSMTKRVDFCCAYRPPIDVHHIQREF
jgi:hypothetical protein